MYVMDVWDHEINVFTNKFLWCVLRKIYLLVVNNECIYKCIDHKSQMSLTADYRGPNIIDISFVDHHGPTSNIQHHQSQSQRIKESQPKPKSLVCKSEIFVAYAFRCGLKAIKTCAIKHFTRLIKLVFSVIFSE